MRRWRTHRTTPFRAEAGGGNSGGGGGHPTASSSGGSSGGSSYSGGSTSSSSSSSSSSSPSTAERRHPRAASGSGSRSGHGGGGYYPGYGGGYYSGYYPGYAYGSYWWPYGAYGYGGYWGWGGGSVDHYVHAASGAVRVLVDPPEARVYVDGYYAGIVDDFDGLFQRLSTSPGRHEITIKLEGYKTYRVKVYVAPDSTLKLRYDLQKGTGETFGGPRRQGAAGT